MSCHQIKKKITEICDGLTQVCVSNAKKNIGQKSDEPSCGQFQPRFALYSSDKKVPRVHLHLCLKPRGGPYDPYCAPGDPQISTSLYIRTTTQNVYSRTKQNCTFAPLHKTVPSHHHHMNICTTQNIHTTQNMYIGTTTQNCTFQLHQFAVLSLLVGWSG